MRQRPAAATPAVFAGLAVERDGERVVVPGELLAVVQAGVEMAVIVSRKHR